MILFIGGPAHGKTIAIRDEDLFRGVYAVMETPPITIVDEFDQSADETAPMPRTWYYERRRIGFRDGRKAYLRSLMAPTGWDDERVEHDLHQHLVQQWIKQAPEVEEVAR